MTPTKYQQQDPRSNLIEAALYKKLEHVSTKKLISRVITPRQCLQTRLFINPEEKN